MHTGGLALLKKLAFESGWQYEEHRLLSTLTTFKIGGPADIVFTAQTDSELRGIAAACASYDVPHIFMGKGSNLLCSDDGYRGAVILQSEDIRPLVLEKGGVIKCGAALKLSALAGFALKNSLTGLEFAHGIPGSAGGAAYMNAGAYGGEMAQVLTETEHIDGAGNLGSLSGGAMGLGYRRSAYSENGAAIIGLTLRLKPGDPAEIKALMDDLMERRRCKQPLNLPSAGSVFKRPEGHFAGGLIEQCGLKGHRIGGAEVSQKHSGFIVNAGGATCADVLRLIDHIKETVLKQTGVALECEIKTL